MSLVVELKRRNVFRVGAAYLALAWVIVQITSTVVPALGIPEWVQKFVILCGAIGFPCVLLFSWAYELTPDGLKRESEIDRSQSITHVTGKRLDYIIVGLLVAAIGVTALDRFVPRGSPVGAGPAREDRAQGALLQEDRAQGALPEESSRASALPPETGVLPQLAAAPDSKSIAVLPFVNMSSDKEQEYFSDGIAEELLNQLAKIAGLKVSARTSSFSFKNQNLEIPEIAQRLHVANVLEGSVRKSGDKVRITAQLVRAADGYHLWSETYDRKLDDIFAVQDEIARAVVTQLKVTLLGATPKTKAVNPQAYSLLLQGRALARQGSRDSLAHSVTVYQQALALDPAYADAWAALSAAYSIQTAQALRPLEEGTRLAREAADKALALEPDLPLAHASLSSIAWTFDNDLVAAAGHLERALALDPRDPQILAQAAPIAALLGRTGQSIALREYLVAQDPVVAGRHAGLARAYADAGRFDEAIASQRTALQLAPDQLSAQFNLGIMLLRKGDAQAALDAIQKEGDESWRLIGLPMVYHMLGRKTESDESLDRLIQCCAGDSAYNIAYVYAWRGETDRAFEWLDKAVAQKDTGLAAVSSEPMLASIHDDPRWLPLLRKLGFAPEQLAAVKFDVEVPR